MTTAVSRGYFREITAAAIDLSSTYSDLRRFLLPTSNGEYRSAWEPGRVGGFDPH